MSGCSFFFTGNVDDILGIDDDSIGEGFHWNVDLGLLRFHQVLRQVLGWKRKGLKRTKQAQKGAKGREWWVVMVSFDCVGRFK